MSGWPETAAALLSTAFCGVVGGGLGLGLGLILLHVKRTR